MYYLFAVSPAGSLDFENVITDSDPLIEQGFLTFSPTGESPEFSKDSKQFHAFLNSLMNSDIYDDNGDSINHLIEYLDFFYSDRELVTLTANYRGTRRNYEEIATKIGSAYWLKQFLDADNLQVWGSGHDLSKQLPLINMPIEDEHFFIAQKIVRTLIDGPAVLQLATITEAVGTENTELISRAMHLLLKHVLVFLSFSEFIHVPVIGIHPSIHRFINPETIKLVKSETQVTSCPPFLIDDMTIMLTEALLDPIPLRQSDNKPYAKSIKEISSRFYQLPPECNRLYTYTDEERVRLAMLTLNNHDLVSIHGKKRDKRNYLYAEKEGRDWLKLSERERLEEMLFTLQNYHKRFYNLNRGNFPTGSECLSKIEIIREEYDVLYTQPNLAGSLYGAFQILADARHTVTESSFFERQILTENPLFTLLHCGVPYMNTTDWQFHNIVDKEEMINFWLRSLHRFMVSKATPYGMLNVSPIHGKDDYAISLSDAGLFFTGNLKKLPVAKESNHSILVQPNFEIVFMTQNPRAEVKLGQFCERLSSGIGTLFKITRSSVLKAASRDLSAAYVLDTMEELSHKPVPPNVTEQVKNWISQCRIVSISTKILFTCPDRETALQIKSSGGEKVEQISDTVIAVSDKKFAKALEKKLEKKGIFKKRG